MKKKIFLAVLIVSQSAAWAVAAEVEYYSVLMEGAKVGYATHSRIEKDGPASPESGLASRGRQVTTTEVMDMTMHRMGTEMITKTREECVETTKGEPISFVSEQAIGMGVMKTEGKVGKDGMVQVKISGAGAGQDRSFSWPKGAIMAEGVRLLSMEKGLKEDTTYDVNIFNPSMMAALGSRVKIGAKEEVDLLGRVVTLTKVEMAISMPGMGEMVITSFIDEKYNALKTVMPMMDIKIELISCEKEFALGSNEIFDIGNKMFMASPEPITEVGSIKSIEYVLRPVGEANNLKIPSSDNQKVKKLEDGSIMVTVEPVSDFKGGTFPYKGTDANVTGATKPNRYLQSGDANIIDLAKKAVGDAKDAAEAAKRIEQFVADYIEYRSLAVGYASALEAARSKKGDCSEYAVLSTAMCRAAGIPARVVVGVAYVDDFMGKSGFGGHAWVEVFIEGKWVGLDPAFRKSGIRGFDAGHIALAMGDGEPVNFFNMATTMGRFKIEKVTVHREK
jgi:hypothetical protein